MTDCNEKTIIYEEIKWKYVLSKKECGGKIKYYIKFTYPTRLQASTDSKSVFNNLKKDDRKNVIDKLESAIKSKYKSKVKDSFNTRFKMFVFYKFFELEDSLFEAFFSSSDEEIKKDFFDFLNKPNRPNFAKELADAFSSQYYQKQLDDDVCFDKYPKKTVKAITEKLFAYDCNGNKTYDKRYVFDMTNDTYRSAAKKKNKNITELYELLFKDYGERHKELFSLEYFTKLLRQTSCTYCGISIEQINELSKKNSLHNKRSETRGYSLEIDRKHPNLEYSSDNCCMSCYWCNNAKTDEFSYDEFKKLIAPGIRTVWNCRLKKAGLNELELIPEEPEEKYCPSA
jgi:hypothetical protein